MTDVVGHHDGIVYHQVQGYGDTCQRIELHLQPKGVIKDESNRNVDRQARHYQEEIAEIPSNQGDKNQKNQDGQSRTEINFVQFLLDVFRGVIADVHFISRRHLLFQFPHGLLHLLAQFQLIGTFLGGQVQVNGIQAIDAIIAGRFRFDVYDLDELVQAHQRSVRRLDADISRLKLRFLPCRSAYQANPFPAARSFLNGTDTQKLLFVMSRYSRLNIRQ